MNTKEKKELLKQFTKEQLLEAIAALEEIVKTKVPDGWEVSKGKLPRTFVDLEEKAEDKILQKLMQNGGELTRSGLYNKARGDRMGLVTFNNALQSLINEDKIAITNERPSSKSLQRIRLLRANANLERPIE